ncbi:hypothetical protein D030_2925A, partial [Vibrio parahaemolyticus AQ3810]
MTTFDNDIKLVFLTGGDDS